MTSMMGGGGGMMGGGGGGKGGGAPMAFSFNPPAATGGYYTPGSFQYSTAPVAPPNVYAGLPQSGGYYSGNLWGG